jgi:tRNA threonylcarbamoyladenosine biosynthesis protein TsaB
VKLLALDTSTECCSVALWQDGATLWRAARAERGHGEHVLRMIDEVLRESGIALRGLDAIAFGAGPGAFTGVRLAASITQGLAFSADLPVLPVSTLRASAQQALWPTADAATDLAMETRAAAGVLVCQDARMSEVYWAVFKRGEGVAVADTPEAVGRPAAVLAALEAHPTAPRLCGAGSGFAAYGDLAKGLHRRLIAVLPGLEPHAREVALLAAHAGLAAARPPGEAQPVYLRNDVAALPGAQSPRPAQSP